MSTQKLRLGAAARLKTPASATDAGKIRFRRIECIDIPAAQDTAAQNARNYKNLHSRFRRFRNRLIIGNPLDAASGLCRSHKGKFDFVYVDLCAPDCRCGFSSGELSAILSWSRELLGECGNICLRCDTGAQRKTRRAADAVFGNDHHVATTARGRGAGDCFVIYRKTDVHICNQYVEPLETSTRDQLSAHLEHIMKTWSSDDSLVAGFFHNAGEAVAVPENAGRRWIVTAADSHFKRAARKYLVEAQSAHHACGRLFRPFDIYAMTKSRAPVATGAPART